jgi:hypothetical protein
MDIRSAVREDGGVLEVLRTTLPEAEMAKELGSDERELRRLRTEAGERTRVA